MLTGIVVLAAALRCNELAGGGNPVVAGIEPQHELAEHSDFTERGFGVRAALGCSDRRNTAVSQLKPGQIDWNEIFGKEGVRWFHTGGIFCAAPSPRHPEVCKEAMLRKMIATAVQTYPNFKAVAATLRHAKTASINDWGAIRFYQDLFHEARPMDTLMTPVREARIPHSRGTERSIHEQSVFERRLLPKKKGEPRNAAWLNEIRRVSAKSRSRSKPYYRDQQKPDCYKDSRHYVQPTFL